MKLKGEVIYFICRELYWSAVQSEIYSLWTHSFFSFMHSIKYNKILRSMQEVVLPTLVHTNLIKITFITCSTLLICRGDMGPLGNRYYESYASELMSCKYNNMINTVMDSFRQLDCGYHAQQLSNIFIILQFPFLLDAWTVPKSKMLIIYSKHQATLILLTLCTFVST